jgi:hypothetical protein
MSKVGTKEAALREQRGSVTTPATTNLTEKDKVAIVEIQAQKEAKVEAKAKAKAEEKKENKKIREKQKAAIKAGEVVTKPTTVTAIAKVTPEPKTAAPKKTNGTAKTTEHKGAFTAKVIDDLMPMVKKGTTLGALISAARWGSCGNPVRRATRFITTVAQGDFGLKVKIEGDGEEAKVKVA